MRATLVSAIKKLGLETEGASRQRLKPFLPADVTPQDLTRVIDQGVVDGVWTQPKGPSGKIYLTSGKAGPRVKAVAKPTKESSDAAPKRKPKANSVATSKTKAKTTKPKGVTKPKSALNPKANAKPKTASKPKSTLPVPTADHILRRITNHFTDYEVDTMTRDDIKEELNGFVTADVLDAVLERAVKAKILKRSRKGEYSLAVAR